MAAQSVPGWAPKVLDKLSASRTHLAVGSLLNLVHIAVVFEKLSNPLDDRDQKFRERAQHVMFTQPLKKNTHRRLDRMRAERLEREKKERARANRLITGEPDPEEVSRS